MYKLHQLQIVICAALGVLFVVIISYARKADEFVADNWEGGYTNNLPLLVIDGYILSRLLVVSGCYYPQVCALIVSTHAILQPLVAYRHPLTDCL